MPTSQILVACLMGAIAVGVIFLTFDLRAPVWYVPATFAALTLGSHVLHFVGFW